MAFLMFVSTPTSTALLTLDGQKLTLPFSIAQLLYKSGALYYGYIQGDLLLGLKILVGMHSLQIILYNMSILFLMIKRDSDEDSNSSKLVSE